MLILFLFKDLNLMRVIKFISILTVFFVQFTYAQNRELDSLQNVYHGCKTDEERIKTLLTISDVNNNDHFTDAAIRSAEMALSLAKQKGYKTMASDAMLSLGYFYESNNFQKAISYYFSNIEENRKNRIDSNIVKTYWYLSEAYISNRADSSLLYAQLGLNIAEKIKYKRGQEFMLLILAMAYQNIGDFPKALQCGIDYLRIIETKGDNKKISEALWNIANLNQVEGDHGTALIYLKKAEKLSITGNFDNLKKIYISLSDVYEKSNDLKNAFKYASVSLNNTLKDNDSVYIGMSWNNLANVYLKLGKQNEALFSYRSGIPFLKMALQYNFLCETYFGLAKIKHSQKQYDSAVNFAKTAAIIANRSGLNQKYLWSCEMLSNYYADKKQIDSAFYYQSKTMLLKDSIFNNEKAKQVQILNIEEDIRQKELAETARVEKEERDHKLKMLLVGLAIPAFLLFCIFLSRIKVHTKVVEFTGILSVLLFFEYLTLLLHPAVADFTHHSPFYEIIIFVAIAAFITPMHHRIQHWMIEKLTKHRKTKLQEIVSKKIKLKMPE